VSVTRTRLPRPVRLADEGSCAPIGRRLAAAGMPDPWLFDTGPRVAAAKVVCSGCPVRQECLDYAVAAGERAGVWGGCTTAERSALVLLTRAGYRLGATS
jgi:WhiB family redox-sensing transcriptional regulator